MSSAPKHLDAIAQKVSSMSYGISFIPNATLDQTLALALAVKNRPIVDMLLSRVCTFSGGQYGAAQMTTVGRFLDAAASQVEPRYLAYTATLKDGQSFDGIITSESGNSMTIKGLDAREQSLTRDSIQSLIGANRSLMPDGLESAVDHRAMADLIQFIRSGG